MNKRILIMVFLSMVIIIILLTILFNNKHASQGHTLDPDTAKISEDFKAERDVTSREIQVRKLLPFLRNGMTRQDIADILGTPNNDWNQDKWDYNIGWSNALSVFFNEEDKVFHITGPGIKFVDKDNVWPFVQIGMTKESVSARMYEPDERLDEGKKWLYKGETYVYTILFDENDKVIELDRAALEKRQNQQQ